MDQVLLEVRQIHDLASLILPVGRCEAERVQEGSISARRVASTVPTVVCGGIAPGRIIVGAAVEGDCAVVDKLGVFAPERVLVR